MTTNTIIRQYGLWKKKQDTINRPQSKWEDIDLVEFMIVFYTQSNWKALGLTLVPNSWIKHLTCLHPILMYATNHTIKSGSNASKWLTWGGTTLLCKKAIEK